MLIWIVILIAVCVGTVMPVQAGVNATLAKLLNHTLHAAVISFIGGAIAMIIAASFTGQAFPSMVSLKKIPPYLFIGGLLGSAMVITSIILAPKLGATLLISCFITGQLAMSVILDHYGVLGFPQHSVSLLRCVGIVFLMSGVTLIKFF